MSVSTFEEYLVRTMRPDTAKDYLQRFQYVCNSVSYLSPQHINTWLLEKKKSGVQGNSLNALIKAVRAYCVANSLKWGKDVPYFKEQPAEKDIFSDSEIESLLSLDKLPYFHPDIWNRWTVFFSILAFSGMRGSEVAGLTVDDVDFGTNNFVLHQTKTRPRRVPIAANLQKLLTEYIQNCDTYLFPSTSKRVYVWRSAWQKHFNIRKNALGLKRKKLTTHSFRHSHVTNLIEEGVSLPDVMQIEGHKNIQTTMQYVHLTNKSAQRAINKHRIVRKHTSPDAKLKALIDEAEKLGFFSDGDFEYVVQGNLVSIWIKGSKKHSLTIEST